MRDQSRSGRPQGGCTVIQQEESSLDKGEGYGDRQCREADGGETGGEEGQECQAEGCGRGPPWERAGSLRVLELDPVVRTVLREALLNTLCKLLGERSHRLKGTQRQSGHPRRPGRVQTAWM